MVVLVVKMVEVNMVVLVVEVVCVVGVVGVVEVVTVVLVAGGFEEAKCPEKREKRLTHFKTMPQAAGKNSKCSWFNLHKMSANVDSAGSILMNAYSRSN